MKFTAQEIVSQIELNSVFCTPFFRSMYVSPDFYRYLKHNINVSIEYSAFIQEYRTFMVGSVQEYPSFKKRIGHMNWERGVVPDMVMLHFDQVGNVMNYKACYGDEVHPFLQNRLYPIEYLLYKDLDLEDFIDLFIEL